MTASPIHVDLILNEWQLAQQRRVAAVRVEIIDDRYAHMESSTLEEIANRSGGGSYLFASDPHSDDECPFSEGGTLPMEVTQYEPGTYVLPAPDVERESDGR